jgi:hypothetical protein
VVKLDELTALRKVFLDLAAEEAAGQIAESTNAGNRERFANGLSKGGPGSGPRPHGGSDAANRASRNAERASATVKDLRGKGASQEERGSLHDVAREEHLKAAAAQSKSGNTSQAKYHQEQAAYHTRNARL